MLNRHIGFRNSSRARVGRGIVIKTYRPWLMFGFGIFFLSEFNPNEFFFLLSILWDYPLCIKVEGMMTVFLFIYHRNENESTTTTTNLNLNLNPKRER